MVPREVSCVAEFGASLTLVERDSVLIYFLTEGDGASGSPELL